MKVYGEGHRVLAVCNYLAQSDSINAATVGFINDCNLLCYPVPKDARGFVQYWGRYFKQHNDVAGAASNSGRKRKLTDAQAEILALELLNWAQAGRKGPYKSIKELRKHSPVAAHIISTTEASDQLVVAAIKKVEPRFTYKLLTVKQKLTPNQRKARLRVAQQHMRVRARTLQRVVWIDAKTMYMTIKTRRGWVLVDNEEPFETTRPASKKNPTTLRYYIAVNYLAGTVYIRFITGTTGMPADRDPSRPYLVSSCHIKPGGLVCLHVSHSQFDCCTPPQ
jgi:hypothetical protein